MLNNLTTNYYTIKETDAQIEIAKDSITSTVSSTYTTKDDMNNTLTTYAKKSDLSQTADNITAKFTTIGSNMLKNGRPRNNLDQWVPSQDKGYATISMYSGGCNWNGEFFKSGLWWRGN